MRDNVMCIDNALHERGDKMARKGNIAFSNLRAEMARKQITIKMMSDYLGITRDTLGNKLSRKRTLNLDEAMKLSKKFFPEYDIYYLFQELTNETPPDDSTKKIA